jgi:cytochrome c-type biogenesis protein CcmH
MQILIAVLLVALQAPDLEVEARRIEAALIAPCCWSQQVSVHQSGAADEIRRDVRRRLAAGETRQQILDAYVAQYGPGILAEPPARGFNISLYAVPILLFLGSAVTLALVVRRFVRPKAVAPDPGAAGVAGAGQYGARLDEELRDLD